MKIAVFSSGFPRLLSDPETLRKQVTESLERERRAVGPVEEEAAHLRGELESLMEERDGYTLRQNARGRLSDEDLDRFLDDTNARRAELEEALDGLAGRRESAGRSSATSRSWTSTWRTSPTS